MSKAPKSPTAEEGRRQRFDPAFADAVGLGLLTPKQAFERGRRDVYAARIRRRHGVSEELSYALADNRVSLAEVVSPDGAEASGAFDEFRGDDPHPEGRASSTHLGTFAAAAVAVTLILGAAAWTLDARDKFADHRMSQSGIREAGQRALDYRPPAAAHNEPRLRSASPPAHISRGSPQVELDESGVPLRVQANTPTSVIRAYCAIDLACDLARPVELAHAAPVSSGLRVGLFSDGVKRDRWAVWIQKDRRTGRWFAGDGKRPIPLVPEMEVRVSGPRLAVAPLR